MSWCDHDAMGRTVSDSYEVLMCDDLIQAIQKAVEHLNEKFNWGFSEDELAQEALDFYEEHIDDTYQEE